MSRIHSTNIANPNNAFLKDPPHMRPLSRPRLCSTFAWISLTGRSDDLGPSYYIYNPRPPPKSGTSSGAGVPSTAAVADDRSAAGSYGDESFNGSFNDSSNDTSTGTKSLRDDNGPSAAVYAGQDSSNSVRNGGAGPPSISDMDGNVQPFENDYGSGWSQLFQ